jgi:hypothetical protein
MSGRLPFMVFELLGARETVEISGHCLPASRGNRERNRKFADSLLEERVRSEPVSEMGFFGPGNYGSIPKRLWMMSEA